jgi:hypothetical protein
MGSHNEWAVKRATELIPEELVPEGQRQDSWADQMVTVLALARRAKCYDAAESIQRVLDKVTRS